MFRGNSKGRKGGNPLGKAARGKRGPSGEITSSIFGGGFPPSCKKTKGEGSTFNIKTLPSGLKKDVQKVTRGKGDQLFIILWGGLF